MEIANVIQRKRRGVQKQRIANAVKTGVSWLVAREAVEVSGSIRVKSRKQPKLFYLVTTYKLTRNPVAVSYTHLDVYKRQELHHPRTGVGMGRRAPNADVIPLCPNHHRLGNESLHVLGRKAFERKYGVTEGVLLEMTLERLSEND